MAVAEIIPAVEDKGKRKLRKFVTELTLVSLSAFLFSLAFPGLFSEKGMPMMAFLFFAPLVPLLKRCSWGAIVPLGIAHAYMSYALYNYWLADFHPLTILIVPVVNVGYYVLLFPLLKAAGHLYPRLGFLVQALIWTAFEYIKSLGFLGYPYGTIGSAFYHWPVLVRASSLTGIWGLSLLAVISGAWLGNVLDLKQICHSLKTWCFYQKAGLGVCLYLLVLLLYGAFSTIDYTGSPRYRIALAQHNADSWQGGYQAFRDNFFNLRELSLQAVDTYDPELVVWPETAFVPTIYYHKIYKRNQRSLYLVQDLEKFLQTQKVPYLIGNDDARMEISPESGVEERVDYNAALLFNDGVWADFYRKRHLVPFTETFPYKEQFPQVYQWLLEADTHFWKKGETFNVVDTGVCRIGTPICFEDTFGSISRAFVQGGADVIVNLSNDAWSGSVVAERQHFMLSVFRAGENRRSMVRSTNSGITAWVDPNGVVREELPPFTEAVMVADVPVYTGSTTLYTLWGDWLPKLCLLVCIAALAAGGLIRLTIRLRSRKIE